MNAHHYKYLLAFVPAIVFQILPILLLQSGTASQPKVKVNELDVDETRSIVVRYREADHWALKAIILTSLPEKWHPSAASILSDAIDHKEPRLRAYAIEALRRADPECLRSALTKEFISEIAGQFSSIKNAFYKERIVSILARAFPELNGKTTDKWKTADWQVWWGKARNTYVPAPWNAPDSRPAATTKSGGTFAIAERWITRAVDLSISGLDVAICIDSTGSMQPTIDAAREGLEEIIAMLRGLSPKFRLGLVHYKDLGDLGNGARLLSPLTDRVENVRESLGKLNAGGGGDIPEAVDRGLECALDVYTMGWTPLANKLVIIIGDAPPHAGNLDKAIKLAKDAFEKPFGKEPRIPNDLKMDKNANRPFITSAIVVNPTPEATKTLQAISDAGGGMCGSIAIQGSSDATKQIVQHILTLTFGRQWKDQAGVFVSIFQEYRRNGYFQ